MISKAKKVFEFVPTDIITLDEIRIKMREVEMSNFLDIEFPPTDSSIYSPNELEKPFDQQIIVWKRPKDFMLVDKAKNLAPPEVFDKKIEPNDIKQGILGNCWLMCALSSLAEMPYLVERLFIT